MNPTFSNWPFPGTEAFIPDAEIQNITSRLYRRIAQEFMSAGTSNLAALVSQGQSLTSLKRPDEIVRGYVEHITELSSKNLEHAKNLCKIYQETIDDLNKWSQEKARAK